MFKRRMQYNQGSGFQMTPAGGVYMPSVEAIGSAVGSGISAVVNELGNPAVLAGSQGIATNINKPPAKEAPAQLPDYQVAAPRAVDRMSAGTTGAMAVQRMASGVGAHPGGAGRGKGAGGSLGQESRQAMKRKRLSKRIANRKAKGKDQIQLSSDAPKVRDDQDYAEGGRVEKAFGGLMSAVKRAVKVGKPVELRKVMYKNYQEKLKIQSDLHEMEMNSGYFTDNINQDEYYQSYMDDYPLMLNKADMDSYFTKAEKRKYSKLKDQFIQIENAESDLNYKMRTLGEEPFYYSSFERRRRENIPTGSRREQKENKKFLNMYGDDEYDAMMYDKFAERGTREPYQEGGAAMTNKNTWAKTPIEKRKMYQEGGNMDSQMVDMMEGPTHTMPDGTVMPGATHGEYEQGLAEGQAEDMTQEGMVPDAQMEEDFVDYVVESTLEPEDTMYLQEALEADPRLSEIFDQVIETASEFSGSGPVEGPGSEVSDSIPARLSDGEFVITSKATEEIGPDNLQGMMEQAEMDADVRRAEAEGGYINEEEDTAMVNPMQRTVNPTEREMRKLQLAANPRTQYRTVYG